MAHFQGGPHGAPREVDEAAGGQQPAGEGAGGGQPANGRRAGKGRPPVFRRQGSLSIHTRLALTNSIQLCVEKVGDVCHNFFSLFNNSNYFYFL